ncbi:PcfJ domain-containing protein [Petrimonas sp.]|uniref:PcfJ domain-containing protein n=1 Tax=Petrimonas sp. TaxID=2023866 RepID=UPI00332C7A5D
MRPKTKLQEQVLGFSGILPPITLKQLEWGHKHCFDHKGYRTKKGITCLDCGHKFEDIKPSLLATIDGCVCQNCGTKLVVTDTRKLKDRQGAYYGIITSFKGFQVFRIFILQAAYKAGTPVCRKDDEIIQHWISPDGKHEVIAKLRNINWYAENWGGSMEIRDRNSDSYDINPYKIYPGRRVIPEVKRNGFTGNFYNISPQKFFKAVLSNNQAETLLKAFEISLFKECVRDPKRIDKYWASIKICIRNNYPVKDASIYFDYLGFLEYFEKDLRNAKYVCPANLMKEHDRLSNKKFKIERKKREEEKLKKALENEKKFNELKGRFFGIVFSDEVVSVKVLESIREYIQEGKLMHHCVGHSEYYLKPDTLVMTAIADSKHVATIEFSLKTFKIIQCRGVANQKPKFHDRIIDLVNRNAGLIRNRMKSGKNSNKAA